MGRAQGAAALRSSWGSRRDTSCGICPTQPRRHGCPANHDLARPTAAAGEAERAAALHVAEARCAAVARLLDEVQELQAQAEEASAAASMP